MANGVWHTGYHIKIELTHADLGHPDRPELLDEITLPIEQRDRELLQCLQHHGTGICRAEEEDRSPWMTIRRRTVDGVTTLVAAHLPVRTKPTADESGKHKALKERIARAAHRHGLSAQIEACSTDGKIRNDVLVSGSAGHIGWEAQYSPITASAVRRRSTAAADRGIMPLWVTNDDRAALIDRAPWVRVDDLPWRAIASDRAMLVRGGVRHLQDWACTPAAQRPCPLNGSSCGGLHVAWSLPALCLPPKPHTGVDALVAASAEGDFVPMKIPGQHNPRASTRLWAPAADRDRWRNIIGEDEALPDAEPPMQASLTFTEEDLDSTCRYGEDTRVFDDRRPRRDHADASGLHTFPEVPQRIFRIPRQPQRLNVSPEQRAEASRRCGCRIWQVGPCAGCGTPIHRYGPGSAHACADCRRRRARRRHRTWPPRTAVGISRDHRGGPVRGRGASSPPRPVSSTPSAREALRAAGGVMAFRALHAQWGTVFAHLADLGCGLDWAAIWRARPPAPLSCVECGHTMYAKTSHHGLHFVAHAPGAPPCALAEETVHHHLPARFLTGRTF